MTTYDSINDLVLKQVPKRAGRVLDVGCGVGALGRKIKELYGGVVVGITYSNEEADCARKSLDEVIVADLNDCDFSGLGEFDTVVCSHVLEHLYRPELVLQRLKRCLRRDTDLIIALPNVLFWRQRLEFIKGNFRYTETGLLDRTHYRFFDRISAFEMIGDAGFKVCCDESDGGFPFARIRAMLFRKPVDTFALKACPGLFAWQFVFRCRLAI